MFFVRVHWQQGCEPETVKEFMKKTHWQKLFWKETAIADKLVESWWGGGGGGGGGGEAVCWWFKKDRDVGKFSLIYYIISIKK